MREFTVLLILEGTYPWYRGGVSEWVHQYLKYSSFLTFNIVQIANEEYLHTPVHEALYNLPAHVQEFERILPPKLSGRGRADLYQWIESIDRQVKPCLDKNQVVHVVNTGFAGWLGKELASRSKKPLILTEHALYWKELLMGAPALECGYKVPRDKKNRETFARMFQAIAADIYSAAGAVISVSECNIPEQRKLGARNVHYIPNGIPESRLRRSNREHSLPLTVGWIGRCAEIKNPLRFFDVIKAFDQYGSGNVEFIMVTCDAGESSLEYRVKAKGWEFDQLKVIWNRASEDYIDRMDALCITSRNESQPLVLFEAIGRKIVPIGWRVGDVTSDYGLILEPGAPAGKLVRSVLDLWHRPEEWSKIVEEGWLNVRLHHTWEKVFSTYHSLFSAIAKIEKNHGKKTTHII